jgi:lariat debranching enzyme
MQMTCFLQIIDYPTPEAFQSAPGVAPTFTFDSEWLAIVRAFNPLFSRNRAQQPFPDEETARSSVAKELEWVKEHLSDADGPDPRVDSVQTFEMTAPGGPGGPKRGNRM